MANELAIRSEDVNGINTIYLTGELDIYSSQKLKDELYRVIDSSHDDIEINCEGLSYIDSTGLGIFVGALKRIKQYGKDIYITRLKDNIRKLFNITGLDKLFKIEE